MRQRSTRGDADRIGIRYLPTFDVRPTELLMISRIWHGWTSRQNADAYESLLRSEIFKGIEQREIRGYRGIHLLRRDVPEGVEFVTVMWFESLDAVRVFAGEDFEAAVVPPKARTLLARFDALSAHYNVLVAPEH
jgi:heme-degrading monooxygenase HmoA